MPLRDDLLNPIPGSNPSGENLRYAPVYDQIKEARREEDEIAQGEWQLARKKADWVLVTKLCSEALAKKSKDLQIASWLAEAALRREGFPGLRGGLDLIRGLLETYWDTLYPEIEDGDLELRATPLDWIGSRLDRAVKSVPLARTGEDWLKYKESRSVPFEADCTGNETKTQLRGEAINEGKLTPEAFDEAVKDTPKAFYREAEEQLDGCLESLASLNQVSEEKFGDSSPNLIGLRKSLEEVRQTVHILLGKKREQEPDEEAPGEAPPPLAPEEAALIEQYAPVAAAAAAAAAPARAPVRPRPKGPLAPEPTDREDAIARVLAGARYLRQSEPEGPAGYLIPLALRWGELRAGGDSPDPGLFEAPATETRQELKQLANQGEWQQALDAVETAVGEPCGRAWLDVQRYAVRACEELGFSNVAAALRSELRALLADIPGLAELSLADDTPTANAETRAWIQEQVTAGQQRQEDLYAAPAREPEPESEPLGEETIDAFKLAVDAARSGRVQEAVEILTRELAQESSGRARFQRKAQLAQVCLAAGYESIAYPILDSLAEEIERRRLEEWEEAEMVAHPLVLLFRCMEKMEIPAEVKQKIYHRICRLDPVQALAVAK